MVIFQTNPFLVSLLAFFFLHQTISKGEIAVMACCFASVLFIAIQKSQSNVEEEDTTGSDAQ